MTHAEMPRGSLRVGIGLAIRMDHRQHGISRGRKNLSMPHEVSRCRVRGKHSREAQSLESSGSMTPAMQDLARHGSDRDMHPPVLLWAAQRANARDSEAAAKADTADKMSPGMSTALSRQTHPCP